jgi:hypothetical protein
MKLKGRRPGVHVEPIILPRPDGDLVFHAKAIADFDVFEQMCPPPEPPGKILPGGKKELNPEDPTFNQQMTQYADKRVAYMVVKGLSDATPDLEWEDVKLDDHTTWKLFRSELRDSGLSDIEISRLVSGVMLANSLSEAGVERARQRFLAGEQAQKEE